MLEEMKNEKNNLDLSCCSDGVQNKFAKRRPKYLTAEEAEEYHIKDINGELLATIPE